MKNKNFNSVQRNFLLTELEKVNDKINIQIKLERNLKEDTPKYKCYEKPLNDLRLHLLEEQKVMIKNLIEANDWIYIKEYDYVTQTYSDYIKKDIGVDLSKKEKKTK